MKLELKRDTFTNQTTIGKLFVNGVEYCDTLEDTDRKLEDGGTKVYGKTCIPRGVYAVVIDWSPKYEKHMPHVLDVPQFEGVRIHAGNYAKDTEGCVLVGDTRGVDFIGNSRVTFGSLFLELEAALLKGETITLEVT